MADRRCYWVAAFLAWGEAFARSCISWSAAMATAHAGLSGHLRAFPAARDRRTLPATKSLTGVPVAGIPLAGGLAFSDAGLDRLHVGGGRWRDLDLTVQEGLDQRNSSSR